MHLIRWWTLIIYIEYYLVNISDKDLANNYMSVIHSFNLCSHVYAIYCSSQVGYKLLRMCAIPKTLFFFL